MNNIKFSIIIPVYNASSYIKECIDSVLNQSYKNYEILVINDGSTDDSLKIINELYNKNNKVIIIDKSNSGVSDTRNLGIEKSNGDYVTFLDADDFLHKETLSKINDFLTIKDYDIIQSNLFFYNTNDCNIAYNSKFDSFLVDNKSELLQTIISFNYGSIKYNNKYLNPRCAGGKFYKLNLIKNEKIIFPKGVKVFEDGIFNIKAYSKANTIYILNESLYYYRGNDSSSTHSVRSDQQVQNELILENLREYVINKELQTSFNYCVFDLLLVYFHSIIILNNNRSKIIKLFKNEYKKNKKFNFMNLKYKYLNKKDRIIYILLKCKLFYFIYLGYNLRKNKKI